MKNLRKLSLIILSFIPCFAAALHYEVTFLASNSISPQGLFFVPNGNLWVASNLSHANDKATYLAIDTTTSLTGGKFNSFPIPFLIDNRYPAQFLFSTEEGTILGVNQTVSPHKAVIVADKSASRSVYKGLEIAHTCCQRIFLYATDFYNGKVDIFDKQFRLVDSFKDLTIPRGYAPFNIKNIKDLLYVTYAKQKQPENQDDEAGFGNGFVDVFSPFGNFIKRLISQGPLNSPWGLALAPIHFGEFSNSLLVGNFGDGKIHAYNALTGQFLGELTDENNNPIRIEGLRSLEFDANGVLYFSTGLHSNAEGSIGTISPR